MKFQYNILFLFLILNIHKVLSYGESDANGTPNYQERDGLNIINLVRMFPVQYRDNYMSNNGYKNIFTGSVYPATHPVYYNASATALAQFHSNDMCVNNCFQHNSCDGTNIWTRFDQYLTCPRGWDRGENIAAGDTTGIAANNLLLCDSPGGTSPCSADSSGYDGHRKNIMNSVYAFVGVGVKNYPSSMYRVCWTFDFTGGSCGDPGTPIYSGFHTFVTPSSSPLFFAIYYDLVTPSDNVDMSLIFANGTKVPMSLKFGVKNQGAYMVNLPFEYCAQYYFQSVATLKTYRYPETGFLQLTKDATCASWSSKINTGTTGSASTTTASSGTTTSSSSTSAATSSTGSTTNKPTTSSSSTSSTSTTNGIDGDDVSNSNIIEKSFFLSILLITYSIVL